VRPVNLIPADERRGAARIAGQGPGASVYVLLGVLAVLLVGAVIFQLSTNAVNDRKSELAQLDKELASLRQAGSGVTFAQAQDIARQRFDNIYNTVKGRFDFERRLRQLSRVLPEHSTLSSLTATVEDGADSLEGGEGEEGASSPSGSGGQSDGRASIQGPAFELEICTLANGFAYAEVMTRMRNLDGVTKVLLGDAVERDTASGSSGTSTQGGEQSQCGPADVQWKLIVGFEPNPLATPTSPATPGGAQTPVEKANTAAQTSNETNATRGAEQPSGGTGGSTP
jgi:Tfp pilus assembly protein PilN